MFQRFPQLSGWNQAPASTARARLNGREKTVTEDNKYNGWSNYATWRVNLYSAARATKDGHTRTIAIGRDQ